MSWKRIVEIERDTYRDGVLVALWIEDTVPVIHTWSADTWAHAKSNASHTQCITPPNLPKRKLSREQALEAWRDIASGEKHDYVAAKFGISRTAVSDIATGKAYKDVTGGLAARLDK